MRLFRSCCIAAAAVLWVPSAVLVAQDLPPAPQHPTNGPPKPSGTTPRTPDGHPDLTGVWNGRGDSLTGVPNQLRNSGVIVDDEYSAHDIATGTKIAAFPRPPGRTLRHRRNGRCRGRARCLAAAAGRIEQANL